MYSLTNNVLTIRIAAKGAELQSIYHEQNKMEYMWDGNPDYWGKKSPVLFPIVGELKNGKYNYNGKEYSLSRHGFARDMSFEVSAQSDSSITFTLESNKQTLEKYPFNFKFSVCYSLAQNVLQVSYVVENTDSNEMFFSVGGHPAFKVPVLDTLSFEDFHLLFENKETVGRYPLSPGGLIESAPITLLNNTNELALTKELFSKDALVFKELQSKSISIVSDKTLHGLKVSFEGFPYMGIWSTKGADFVCIEPWCGIADTVASNGNIEEKEGINKLSIGQVFERSFSIEVF